MTWRPRPRFARCYIRASTAMEARNGAERRVQLLAGLSGDVVEVGAGNGLNFRHYPSEVTRVYAVEPEPTMREAAYDNASRAQVPVDVVEGFAERVPLDDASVDAGVVSLVLCSVADQRQVLDELFRVMRPGGQLRFFEHIKAESAVKLGVQRFVDKTVWPLVAGGCHTARDTLATIEAAGFEIEARERFDFPDIWLWLPSSPHVLGTARRP